MHAKLDIRSIESPIASEIYITATPGEDASVQSQAQEIFDGIQDIIRSKKANILQERIFARAEVLESLQAARGQTYGDSESDVTPGYLISDVGTSGPIGGVQVYAISSDSKPEVISVDGFRCGRILRLADHTILTLSGISAGKSESATTQARDMLEKAESALRQFHSDFLSVPRTWMWLCDILTWYDDFNQVRNDFFKERGLIGEGTRQSMPASTGIGLCSSDGSKCAMDLIAVLEPAGSTEYLAAVGKQQCALDYGSAFSRASRALTPAGQTVFVSGTASIDANGITTNIDNAAAQINTTIENVRAVLKDMHAKDEDVVHAVAYCKTTEVEQIFRGVKNSLPWPWVTAICDICRPDLLFEVEATAVMSTQTR
jgi:enamine deaminase RidA (YjgF/YER057c/UK114 family)